MNVVIAVDRSELAAKTFDWYMTNLHKDENHIYICHEAEQPDFPSMMFAGGAAFPADEVNRIVQEHTKKLKELEKRYTSKCKENNLEKFKILINTHSSGNPGHGIIKQAKEVHADLIVMGTRGLGAIRRTILGSVSDYVLHHSHIPVAICHQ